jgi:hypothetical protein
MIASAEKGAQDLVGVDNDGSGLGGKASCTGWLRGKDLRNVDLLPTYIPPSSISWILVGTY